MPSYFPENNTAAPFDDELRSLQKIVDLGGGGAGAPSSTPKANYTAARADTYGANQGVLVLGYAAAGDGGGGWFWYNSADTTADNDGSVLRPTAVAIAAPGRLNRV